MRLFVALIVAAMAWLGPDNIEDPTCENVARHANCMSQPAPSPAPR